MIFVVQLHSLETFVGAVETVVVVVDCRKMEDSVALVLLACLAQTAQDGYCLLTLSALLHCEGLVEVGAVALVGLETVNVGLCEPLDRLFKVVREIVRLGHECRQNLAFCTLGVVVEVLQDESATLQMVDGECGCRFQVRDLLQLCAVEAIFVYLVEQRQGCLVVSSVVQTCALFYQCRLLFRCQAVGRLCRKSQAREQ